MTVATEVDDLVMPTPVLMLLPSPATVVQGLWVDLLHYHMKVHYDGVEVQTSQDPSLAAADVEQVPNALGPLQAVLLLHSPAPEMY